MKSEHIRNIALDILFTLLTCGLFNIYVQYRQMIALNAMLKEPKYSFLNWLVLTLITFGIYHVYHEYRVSTDLARLSGDPTSNEALINVALTVFGFHIVGDAIQQSHINRFFGSHEL